MTFDYNMSDCETMMRNTRISRLSVVRNPGLTMHVKMAEGA